MADPASGPLPFGAYGFAPPAPQPGNWLTAGLASGWHQGLGALGGTTEAAGQLLGMPALEARGRGLAEAQGQQAQAASRPDLEQAPWYQPSAIGYRLAQMIPGMAGAIGGATAAAAFAPEEAAAAGVGGVMASLGGRAGLARLLGGAGAMYPQIAGSNVEAAKQANEGALSSSDAAKALALGVPEAAAAGFVPGKLTSMFERGVTGGPGARFFKGALSMGGYNAAQMGAQSAITQQAFTPEMPIADRARGIVDAAMSGALGGGVFGGLTAVLRPATAPVVKGPPTPDTAALDTASKPVDPASPGAAPSPTEPLALPSPSPTEPLALSPPGQMPSPVARMTDADLQAQVTDLAEKAKRPARGFFQGGLGSAQAGIASLVNEEAARRAPLGETPGPGFTMSEPGADRRGQQVSAFRDQVVQDLPKPALKDPLFQNFDAADPPDLINALKDSPRFDAFINEGKTPPKWFQALATKYGVMNGADEAPTPQERVETAGQALIAKAKEIQNATDETVRAKLVDDFRGKVDPDTGQRSGGLYQEYQDAKQIAAWHAEADTRSAASDAVTKGPPLPSNPTGEQLLSHPVIADRIAKMQVVQDGRVPDAAGIDPSNPSLVHVDSRIPPRPTIMGIPGVPVLQLVGVHEIAESYGALTLGEKYDVAHPKMGVPAESKAVQDFAVAKGVDPKAFQTAYDDFWNKQIKVAAKDDGSKLAPVAEYPYDRDVTRGGQEERANAPSQPSTAGMDAREPSTNGGAVGEGNPEGVLAGARATGEGDAPAFENLEKYFPQEEPEAGTPAAPEEVIHPAPEQHAPVNEPAPRALTPEQEAAHASVREKVGQVADHERLQMALEGEDGATKQSVTRKAAMQKALDSGDPVKVGKALAAYDRITEARLRAPRSDMADREVGAPAARFQDNTPDWLQGHVKDTNGTVVQQDGENALLRGFDFKGEPIYMAVNRALDRRSMTDIDAPEDISMQRPAAPWMTPKLESEFKRAKQLDMARDAAAQRAMPDGPFTGKEGQVVGTASVDPRLVSWIGGLTKQLGLGNLRILLVHPGDVADDAAVKGGLNGDYISARTAGMDGAQNGHVRFFGPNAQDAYIYVRPGMSEGHTIETAAHEVGHIIDEVALRTAPAETRAAVDAAYDKWYRATQGGMSLEDLYLSKRATFGALDAQHAIETGELPKTMSDMDSRDLRYLTSKKEWFADQVARWATTAAQPRSIIEQFFAAVGQKLRQLASLVTGHPFMPDAAVSEFLEHMGPGSDQQWLSMNPKSRLNLMMQDREPPTDPRQMESMIKGVIQTAESATPKLVRDVVDGTTNMRGSMRRIMVQLASSYGIRDGHIAATMITSLKDFFGVGEARRFDEQPKNKVNVLPQQMMAALPEAARAKAQQFIADAQQWREMDINPYKPWADHGKLLKADNAADLFKIWQGASNDLAHLKSIGADRAVDAFFSVGKTAMYQRLAAAAFDLGYRNKDLQTPIMMSDGTARGLPTIGPSETFRNRYDLHNDVHVAEAHWQGVVAEMDAVLDQHIKANETAASVMTPEMARAHRATIGDLSEVSRQIKQGLGQVKDGMYAPFQHGTGNYFMSAKLATDATGTVKPGAIAAMQKMMQDGDWHVAMHTLGDNQASFFTRIDTPAKQDRFYKEMVQLQKDGHLDPGEPIKTGEWLRPDVSPSVSPREVHEMIQRFRQSVPDNVDADTKAAIVKSMTEQWLDMKPDHSLQHFLERRTMVHGYDPNMQANMALYLKQNARNTSMMERGGQMADARQMMAQQLDDAKGNPAYSVNQKNAASELVREAFKREEQQAWRISNPMIDLMTSAMHSIVIGFSPAYFFTMQSQLATLGWGELAKSQGYAKAAMYMAGATGRAFNLLNAVARSKDWSSLGFRDTTMRGHGSEKDIATIMKLDAAGGLTAYTKGMTDPGSEKVVSHEKFQQMANFLGLYSETLPRLIMALATADAHDANPGRMMRAGYANREDAIKNVVNQSMFQWGPEMASRFTGKAGFFGSYGKIAFGFTRFHTMLIEKMYREMHDLIGGDSSPEQRRQAGVFLGGHLVAVTALAGTLGLPMAAAFTGATDKVLSTLTGKDDVDVEGLYRTWLSHTFGPEVGDVLAKGLPRALGVDFSHLGTQNILPGTSILTDKRKLEDKLRDFTQTAAGPAVHEAGSIFLGGRDMLNGDYLLGLTKVLPEGFKGLAEALYAGTHGFVDKYGQGLVGGQPSAADLAKMAIGLDPTTLARYNEGMRIFQSNRAAQEYHEQNINRHLTLAMTQHDPDSMRYWVGQATDYTRQHPLMGGPLSNIGATLQQHMMLAAQARAMGTPIGVPLLDPAMRNITGFLKPGP